MTLADLLADWLPEAPTFDLTIEPWIDITDLDGTHPRAVGLDELLHDAHRLRLADVRGPLHAHAMVRWLTAHAYLLHHAAPRHAWDDVANRAAPLPTAAVDALLDRMRPHLWLHHPKTPFLQDLAVLPHIAGKDHKDPARALDSSTHPYLALLPDVPTKSNAAWFNRPDDSPVTPADAANHLLQHHYWALPGNLAPNTVAGGKTSVGGPTGMTNAGRVYVHAMADTVAATMAANLHRAIAAGAADLADGPVAFWEDPTGMLARLGDPVWTYTATGVSQVLIPAPHDPTGWRLVRSPRTYSRDRVGGTPSQADLLKERMADGDPHTVCITGKDGGRSYPRLFADNETALARLFHRKIPDNADLRTPSLLQRSAPAIAVPNRAWVYTAVEGAGTPTGALIANVGAFIVDPGILDLTPWQARRFAALADRVVYAKGSAGTHVSSALARVAAGERTDGSRGDPPRWVYDRANDELAGTAEPVLASLLSACRRAASPTNLPDRPDVAQRDRIIDLALDVYDRAVPRLGSGPAHTARAIEQRHHLLRRLRTDLAKEVA